MNVGEVAYYPVDPTNASASIVRIYTKTLNNSINKFV